ncbi:LysM peptidoglycan-binding domain-containing protein [Coraliomargarita akajimensis]|uniref:Peptidoglycan-binding lysin domain protein n=1 Tax=Coraliomargarita akajimensis (strain DSM 45221 / IAM 15411 / JCM 23193 / KCTC 12865 / 04OKA010-24) TaxID=583355 RepID=D5EKQ7_CORAD|nr:LysM peptidoglycan-binding domain-containing protein [Coraliomargarita akajimensis]ADE54964.1 Peptidoglycan-binding lysin domain protein [Coraliomargarita akajimensis DSM 45221]
MPCSWGLIVARTWLMVGAILQRLALMYRLHVILPILILSLWGLSACSPGKVEIVRETDEKQYQRGQHYKATGRIEEALDAFLGVIDSRRDAPESHLEAGYIFLREMKDPMRANYHFNRYIELKPQSERVPQVRQLIETAQKEFARQLPAQPYEGDLDRLDMMELLKSMRQENDSLKRDLMAAQKRVQQLEGLVGDARRTTVTTASPTAVAPPTVQSATSVQSTAAANQPSGADVPRSYRVQSGDSLSTISRKFYGTPSRWIDIYQANRDRLSSENALKVGQELRIP